MERAAAGREHAEPRDGVEQRRDRRERLLEVLEVVQHEQPGLRPEPLGDRLDRPLVLALLDPERRCDRREHALRVGHRREVDERRTAERRRRGQGKRRLAGAARAGERHEPRVVAADERRHRRQLPCAPDEHRLGHGARRRLGHAGRGEGRIVL